MIDYFRLKSDRQDIGLFFHSWTVDGKLYNAAQGDHPRMEPAWAIERRGFRFDKAGADMIQAKLTNKGIATTQVPA